MSLGGSDYSIHTPRCTHWTITEGGLVTPEQQRILDPEKKIKRIEMENEILEKPPLA